MTGFFNKALLATCLVAVAGSASATSSTFFDFANLQYNKTSGSGFTGFLPSDGIACTGGDLCSSDIGSSLGGDLTYSLGGLTVSATGSFSGSVAAVVQDHDNGYNGIAFAKNAIGAGLGVYHKKNDSSDDNITVGEALKMHFSTSVSLSDVGLRSDGHNTTNWKKGATLEYKIDGGQWTEGLLLKESGKLTLNVTGQDFSFRYGGGNADQFYLSSMTVTAVPEPEAVAMMLAGLCLIGGVMRRRKGKVI